jgi:hypothetical protein
MSQAEARRRKGGLRGGHSEHQFGKYRDQGASGYRGQPPPLN